MIDPRVAEGDAFRDYWNRLELRERARKVPAPVISWRRMSATNEVESLIWERVHGAARLLDFGSGDQALKRKFSEAGFKGRYDTFDVSREFATTYSDVSEIGGPFDAVLCLEVIEHMPLAAGLELRERLVNWLAPGGTLVLSTPNPGCIRSPFAADETHQHLYPLPDLLAWAMGRGLEVEARRVRLLPEVVGLGLRVRLAVQQILLYFVGADRADGSLLIARKPSHQV